MALVKCRECGSEMSSTAKACPKCGAAGKKKTSTLTWVVGGVLSFAVLISISNRNSSGGDAPSAAVGSKPQKVSDASAMATEVAACKAGIDDKKKEYAKQMAAGKYWDAARAIGGCYNLLNDPVLKKMVADAEVKAHAQVATDAKEPAAVRVKAIEMLVRDYPEQSQPFAKQLPELQAKADQAARAEDKKHAQAEAARRKKEGVSLGMSKEEVLASSWGRPESINRSHGSWGEHEQWVYSGHRGYRYFENGKLTSIQN